MPGLLLLLLILALPARAEPPPGRFSHDECVQCHAENTPALVKAWRSGPHGTVGTPAGCIACHGDRHAESAARARRSEICIACHGGPDVPAVRSYLTSKHGVIVTLEGGGYDFSRRLVDANYRAPTCAYCHLYDGAHGAAGQAVDACIDCHSPRYIDTLIAAGERGLDIGLMKMREAEDAVAAWQRGGKLTDEEVSELYAMLRGMREGALADLRRGTVHQSPDFQWWFGQAALDGALLRIKARLSRIDRQKQLDKR
ncbi:MAG: multiheme c-type cytochrome [Alphaproteobacteria bacterium]|jgi:hypothetical protein|nr:multiheme c-type cytochrome [Alphaproteobacteria bacterium]